MPKRKPYPKGSVCKPCWELRYCPYGPLVEYFPFAGSHEPSLDLDRRYEEVLSSLKEGRSQTEEDIWEDVRMLHLLNPDTRRHLLQYEPEDVSCRILGHVCPVFFLQSGATETKDGRPEGRAIPRDIMLKVVRRDNHVCQLCHTYVPDDQLEFDHIIPFSRGGATTVGNIRLLCRTCNRKKSNALDELLFKRPDA